MEFHNIFGHPGGNITRRTARMAGFKLSGTWSPCVLCFEARMRRHTVPKPTDNRANVGAGRLFIDIMGPFHNTSPGEQEFRHVVRRRYFDI